MQARAESSRVEAPSAIGQSTAANDAKMKAAALAARAAKQEALKTVPPPTPTITTGLGADGKLGTKVNGWEV